MIAINLEANEASVKENNYRALYEYKPTRDDELELKVFSFFFYIYFYSILFYYYTFLVVDCFF